MTLANSFKKILISGALSTEKSRIIIFGRMDWTLEPSVGMAQLIQLPAEEVEKRFGESGKDFLLDFGYKNGKVFFEEIKKILNIDEGKKLEVIVSDILEFIGIGQIKFEKLELNPDGSHHIVVHMFNNPIVEGAKKLYGDRSMVCYFFMGLFSYYIENILQINSIRLIENKCICRNDEFCEWESRC